MAHSLEEKDAAEDEPHSGRPFKEATNENKGCGT
jgi:hypothetical protein